MLMTKDNADLRLISAGKLGYPEYLDVIEQRVALLRYHADKLALMAGDDEDRPKAKMLIRGLMNDIRRETLLLADKLNVYGVL
jgi:hypothetical protein